MARKLLVTVVILSVAWLLMLTYQIFTNAAFASVAYSMKASVPLLASGLSSNINIAVFICGFAWMFVLSSVISRLMFGPQRRLSLQFLVSLFLALTIQGILGTLKGVGLDLSNPRTILSNSYARIFNNSLFSLFYLSLPFVVMVAMDLRAIGKAKR
jgi:hypothetical protein